MIINRIVLTTSIQVFGNALALLATLLVTTTTDKQALPATLVAAPAGDKDLVIEQRHIEHVEISSRRRREEIDPVTAVGIR